MRQSSRPHELDPHCLVIRGSCAPDATSKDIGYACVQGIEEHGEAARIGMQCLCANTSEGCHEVYAGNGSITSQDSHKAAPEQVCGDGAFATMRSTELKYCAQVD